MPETIYVEFDKNDLPKWAQRHKEVIWLCGNDLAFRCDVVDATSAHYKRFLLNKARRQYMPQDDY